MDRYNLSKDSNSSIAQAVGACVGTVLTVLLAEGLNKWLGDK